MGPRTALPAVDRTGPPLGELLERRRSVRQFTAEPLALAEIGQLLWAAQGIVDAQGRRTAPSAGALYPLELYVVASRIEGLAAGVYRYLPAGHQLVQLAIGDRAEALSQAALAQAVVARAAANIVVTGIVARTAVKYGDRALRYVQIETGHATQNALLQATALELGAAPIGAFDDEQVRALLGARGVPLAIIAVGRAADR